MICAYDKIYLDKARTSFGFMLDFAVHDCKMELGEFWKLFLNSHVSKRFEIGDGVYLAGRSGIEMARDVIGDWAWEVEPRPVANRSEEYWLGWALAYYQWETGLKFAEIIDENNILKIKTLYHPYHEMDIIHFCDKMNEIFIEKHNESNIKRMRIRAGLTQAELAKQSGIPVRTIQQYEQKQKNINKAQAEYIIKLSKVLYCSPEELLEKVQVH